MEFDGSRWQTSMEDLVGLCRGWYEEFWHVPSPISMLYHPDKTVEIDTNRASS